MINRNLNKKGALEAKMLISIILLIAGFGIILFMYSQLNWTGNIDREVCHESVILRGTLPEKSIISTKDVVPLKCKTRNICITSKLFGKGNCNEFGNEYNTIRISKDKMEQEIKMTIAREMADCWSMMGEGKIKIFSRGIKTKKSCSICSRIAFDNSIKENPTKIKEFGKYLINHKVPNKEISYWDFLSSGLDKKNYDSNTDVLSSDEKAIIFVETGQTIAPQFIADVLKAGTGCTLGAKMGAGIGFIVPGGVATGGLVGCVGGAVIGIDLIGKLGEEIDKKLESVEFSSANFLVDYSKKSIDELGCDSLESIS